MENTQTRGNRQAVQRESTMGTWDESGRRYFVQHEFGGSVNLTTTIAHALAEATMADVRAVEQRLGAHFDPAAMDQLFKPPEDGLPRVRSDFGFTIWDLDVTVRCDGWVVISKPPRGPQASH